MILFTNHIVELCFIFYPTYEIINFVLLNSDFVCWLNFLFFSRVTLLCTTERLISVSCTFLHQTSPCISQCLASDTNLFCKVKWYPKQFMTNVFIETFCSNNLRLYANSKLSKVPSLVPPVILMITSNWTPHWSGSTHNSFVYIWLFNCLGYERQIEEQNFIGHSSLSCVLLDLDFVRSSLQAYLGVLINSSPCNQIIKYFEA